MMMWFPLECGSYSFLGDSLTTITPFEWSLAVQLRTFMQIYCYSAGLLLVRVAEMWESGLLMISR
jgi:hypothetical protein